MSGVKIVLHLGAHKTATTYLQARLAKSANTLRQMQVGYVELQAFRDAQTRAGGLRRAAPRYALLRHRALRREMDELIRRETDFGARRVVLSDENIPGSLTEFVSDHMFYRSATTRVRSVVDALSGHDVEIAISVRDYASFLPSVWSHMVMRDGYRRFDPAIAAKFFPDGRGWSDLLHDIRRAVPDRAIRFWAYEDLHHAEPEVLEALVGSVARAAVEPLNWQALMGLSAPAVKEIERLTALGESVPEGRIRKIARHFCKSQGYRQYVPWPDETARQLSVRYSADLEAIAMLDGVTRIGAVAAQRVA